MIKTLKDYFVPFALCVVGWLLLVGGLANLLRLSGACQ